MNVWEIDKLVLFIILFIPGFISIKVYDLLMPTARRDFSTSLFEVIGYSCLNFAALFWLIILIHSGNFYEEHEGYYFFLLFVIIFIVPVWWSLLFVKLSLWRRIAKYIIHPIQKPWDYVFGKKQAFWVIVHLTDGRKIGGKFDTNSFASSYPAEEQIYLEETWKLDEKGRFMKPIERSKGILLLGKEILAIEFLE